MQRALNRHGQPVLAIHVTWEDGPFMCPDCQGQVVHKQGSIREPHFAHAPDAVCKHASPGESEMHRQAKQEIADALVHRSGVSEVQLERPLGEVRPDVSFCYQGTLVALEIQISTLSPEEIEWRTLAYTRQNIAVLWTPPGSLKQFEERYAPQAWERYLHTLYFGKVYYWHKGLLLQPLRFQPYMIPPSRHFNERRSKRFVTLEQLQWASILDLTVVWRNAWKTFPRAKLWCQRKEG